MYSEQRKVYYTTIKGRYANYKGSAKRRGIKFELTLEDFKVLWQQPCYYCGGLIDTIGVDRINSSLNDTLDNIRPSCGMCNVMKLDSDTDIFLNKIKQIYDHLRLSDIIKI